mgnify:CR=1 FL=1
MNRTKLLIIIIALAVQVFVPAQKKEYTVEAVQALKVKSYGNRLGEIQWYQKGAKFSFLKYDSVSASTAIWSHDVVTCDEKVFLTGADLKTDKDSQAFIIQNYLWSPNEKYILFTGALNARSLKTGGAFYIYNTDTKKFFLLASSGEQMNANFSPDSKKVAFVRNNNVFVVDIETLKETQLTFDGTEDIINGHSDWVYEEEFSLINGIDWSSDSKQVAFYRFDQRPVPSLQIAKWDSLHFNFLNYHYPKPGDNNSLVSIGIADLEEGVTRFANLGHEKDIYIPRIKFTKNPTLLSIQRLNRLQNKIELLFVDTKTGDANTILTDKDSCWIEVHNAPLFLEDGKSFVWLSAANGYQHLYLYNYSGKLISHITKGNWEVDKLVSVDTKNETAYYISSERGPVYRDLYSVSLNGKNKKLLTPELGTHDIILSSNCNYFIDEYSNLNALPETSLYSIKGDKLQTLVKADMNIFADYGFAKSELTKFKTSDGVELNACIIKPANFDASKKYPVLMYNYSGPGSQVVQDKFSFELWHQLLASKGYIVFMLDNRGTGARGKAFRNLVYRNLGSYEANDQIEGAKYLASLPFVDSTRIGIWGWSYGGYTSALTFMKGAGLFKAAIAVAPVTDWRFYDNIYTERYMSLPSLNAEGYKNSAVMKYVKNMKGKFLLVHGTADDNVHFQNSVTLVNKLIEEGKQFETMYYPGKEHSIRGTKTRIHLYTLLTNFILNNL